MSAASVERRATGGYFSLFGLPPTLFDPDALDRLGSAMANTRVVHASGIASGYVYLGQLITHDVTNLAPVEREFAPPDELINLSSASLDLSNVYGAGLEGKCDFIDKNTGKMKLGMTLPAGNAPAAPDDLPRDKAGIARIADKRDDENLLLAQLHVQFLKLHNFFVDCLAQQKRSSKASELFAEARLQTILHYQQVVLYDFLDSVIDSGVWEYVIGRNRGSIWNPTPAQLPRVPVEFSAAAFRFAHSMVRGDYSLGQGLPVLVDVLFTMTGSGRFGGARALPASHVVDWSRFFRYPGQKLPPIFNFATFIDVSVPIKIPPPKPNDPFVTLAAVDLRTGNRSLLPDAQTLVAHILETYPELAAAARLRPLDAEELNPPMLFAEGLPAKHGRIFDLLGGDYGFERKTPLWYYVLAESQATHDGNRLGPLGSIIVAETLRGLIALSTPSVLKGPFASLYIEPTKEIHGERYLRMLDLTRAVRPAAPIPCVSSTTRGVTS